MNGVRVRGSGEGVCISGWYCSFFLLFLILDVQLGKKLKNQFIAKDKA